MLNSKNPEFIKNIWLEINSFRLIATPIILSMVFLLGYLYGEKNNISFEYIAKIFHSLYFIFIFFIGTSKSSYSILNEVIGKTWDSQIMSSNSPSKIILSKLFGSTSFCWYVGLFCLTGYFISIYLVNTDSSIIVKNSSFLYKNLISLILKLLFLILSGILVQIIALYLSINAISSSKMSSRVRVQVIINQIIAIIVSYSFFSFSFGISFNNDSKQILWYDTNYNYYKFYLIFMIISICWFLIGSIRLTMKEFQYNLKPYFWLLFILYCIVYTNGFSAQIKTNPKFIDPMFIVTILTYIALLKTPKEFTSYKKIIASIQSRYWMSVFENIPLWLASYMLIIPIILYEFVKVFIIEDTFFSFLKISLAILSAVLFLTRDILIFYYCGISGKTSISNARPLLYIGILYMIIPAILVVIESRLVLWFIPSKLFLLKFGVSSVSILEIIIPSIIHLSLIIFLLRKKIKNITNQ